LPPQTLIPGTRIGPYEVLSAIGAGGMGEVYRAVDTNLKRQVAIKVLPQTVGADRDRLARFQREAELLAALNHPNIAQIYGLEKQDRREAHEGPASFLVMELVEGPTLADLIARRDPTEAANGRDSSRGLALKDALDIARQIAEALDAAHQQAIVHRDLKPANVKVRADGTVKVLDFGLAKAMEPAGPSSATHSPTLSIHATQAGVILGTAAYMSPEQASGKVVDKRCDVWSFGVVLLEMLTGRPVFTGETVSHVLAAILTTEPDWTALPADTPASIRRLLRRCLEKDPRRRLHDIADARIEIEDTLTPSGSAGFADSRSPQNVTPSSSSPVLSRVLVWTAVLATAVAVIALAALAFRRPAAELRPLRLSIVPPPGTTFARKDVSGMPDFAISPDGRRIAFVASAAGGRPQLWIQELASGAAQPLPGTSDASGPFWAPDSQSLAFYARGKLKRVSPGGAAPQDLADAPVSIASGAWNADGIILFVGSPEGGGALSRVSAEGGAVVPATTVDATKGETLHVWPQFLPDGRRFIFFVKTGIGDTGGVYVGSLDSRETTLILRSSANAVYATSGHLLFEQSGNLMLQPFDPGSGALSGQAFTLGDRIVALPAPSYLPLSIAADGTMAYWNGRPDARELLWFERNGRPLGTLGSGKPYLSPALSPDARNLLVSEQTTPSASALSIVDVSSGVASRVTFPVAGVASYAHFGIWSPDGKDIVHSTRGAETTHIVRRAASGIGQEAALLAPPALFPEDWSRDGRWLVYDAITGKTFVDIWALDFADGKPRPILEEPANQLQARLSPDGRWLAYASDESGDWEVYVRPFPEGRGKRLVSTGGGSQPLWRGDGKELFYVAADNRIVAVPILAGQTFATGERQPLFATRIPPVLPPWRTEYAVSPDGQRFLVNSIMPETERTPITIAVNWQAAAK